MKKKSLVPFYSGPQVVYIAVVCNTVIKGRPPEINFNPMLSETKPSEKYKNNVQKDIVVLFLLEVMKNKCPHIHFY